jgi:hypothetical protein
MDTVVIEASALLQQVLQTLRHMGKAVLVRCIAELSCAVRLHALVGVPAGHRLAQHPARGMHQHSGGAVHQSCQGTSSSRRRSKENLQKI